MPWIMENGSKDIQLEAMYLLAKVQMKLGAIKLTRPSNSDEMQEESKIADEALSLLSPTDDSLTQTYQEAFYS